MIYPSWYPDCQYLAVDVGSNQQVEGQQLIAQINASTGVVVAALLANDLVWAGFPSVNQADPRLISFAGQFNSEGTYYNQDLNYTWVTNRSTNPPRVTPMDRRAPAGPGFLQTFQARAGWWSPDGKWFAFESSRSCDQIDGQTYAIFIQDANGSRPAMQVTSCHWNAQHPCRLRATGPERTISHRHARRDRVPPARVRAGSRFAHTGIIILGHR
jgi:WD40-like Beta Propeller Repeat